MGTSNAGADDHVIGGVAAVPAGRARAGLQRRPGPGPRTAPPQRRVHGSRMSPPAAPGDRRRADGCTGMPEAVPGRYADGGIRLCCCRVLASMDVVAEEEGHQ